MKKTIFVILALAFSITGNSQVYLDNITEDDADLYAQTKQVNQFFRRFNAEENKKGKRLYEGDRNYRSPKLRGNYILSLFDSKNYSISTNLKNDFINDVNGESSSQFVDFYKENWYAEIDADFTYKGKKSNLIMYLKIEKDRLGYKWAISNIYFHEFEKQFFPDTTGTTAPHFIHPMSHEIHFMSLRKVFDRTNHLEYYSIKEFKPDYLTLFIYEIKNGNLKYEGVNDLKFHFLQLDGWYFEVKNFNRGGFNSGWLISNLLKVSYDDKKNFKF